MHRDSWLLVVIAACTPSAAGDAAFARHAQPAHGIDIAHCLASVRDGVPVDEARCPGFLVEPLRVALQTCAEVDGTLAPASASDVWALDVNADGKPELTFEYEGNVWCEGAPSIFSCGSLGCPLSLYQRTAEGWRAIAAIYADSPESIEVLDTPAGARYRDLRVGCIGAEPCSEYWYYEWAGELYDRTYLEVRGFRVDFAGSPHGLYGLAGETAVLATPEPGARVLERYGPDTEVAIVGTAVGAPYYYVSPCNACESGFVATSAVRMP